MPLEALEAIEYAANCALTLLTDVDLKLVMFNHYGKGFMKTCRVSPDAFIQMALQLAYFRVSQTQWIYFPFDHLSKDDICFM